MASELCSLTRLACVSALCGAPSPRLSPVSSTLCVTDPAYQMGSLLIILLTHTL